MNNTEENYDIEIEPVSPVKKRKNTRKKRIEKQIKCKYIMLEEECKLRQDCLFNKKKLKCRKKPEETEKENELEPKQKQMMDDDTLDKSKNKDKNIAIKNSTCDELDMLRKELNDFRKIYDTKIQECEEMLFGEFIEKYFNKGVDKLNHKDLLNGLQEYYIEEKTKKPEGINFILSMQEFIQKFSQKTSVKGSNYKRQHIFEAICRLLVFFNYDRGELGTNKHFYKSLEGYIKGNKNTINDDILKMKVNEGSASGIVDIFFKSKKGKKDDKLWACETVSNEEDNDDEEEKDEFIMIQNKYYDKEKSNISNYDVTRIYTLADRTNKEQQKFDGNCKIILMVNNGDAVSNNLVKAKQQYPGLLDKKNGIVGISILDGWFQQMLYELYTSKTINKFLENQGKKSEKKSLQLRFHQKFIINCTKKSIENNISKFIWGAVPRSGKSYMIGGLIDDRYKNGNKNNIIIILGALTETLKQFKDMFIEEFSNFLDYKIISPDSNEKEGELNIYLFSQEWLKDKVECDKINKKLIPSTSRFNDTFKNKYPKLFEKGTIDLYFDEVHKGGSTDISEGIIHSFNNETVKIDIFIMVTATFAKPTLRYDSANFIGSGSNVTETIEWSYNDQQNMKSLNDETKKILMINNRSGIQQEVLNDIFIFYQEYYGSDYLNALSKEYQKHPELVLITPECIDIQSSNKHSVPSTIDIRNIFLNNLQCSACEPSKNIDFYKNPANIFNKLQPVDDLLSFINHHIYNYFKITLKYPIDAPHTELWFLPDKHLYGTDTECKEICKSVGKEEGMDEDDSKSKGIPNIEPLTRGLSIKICNHRGFDRYNVLIVHNTKFTYLGTNINSKDIFSEFKNDAGKERIRLFAFEKKKETSLAEQIKDFEKDSYKNGKSLIILTGAKLRLGISLPCADIAFNFDDIKSIDNNYQTMFRVLTERTKPELKKYGYYLDFNKGRSIQFIYEYNKIYGEAKKLQTKEALEALQSLLFTFSYNGLNLIKNDTTDELNLYNKLISKLELDEQGFTKFWSKKDNIVSFIKKSLASSGNIKLLQQLKKFMSGSKVKQNPKIGIVGKEGQIREELPVKISHDDQLEGEEKREENEEEPDENDNEDYGELINTISEELPTIIALLAIFSNDEGYECQNIEECLQTNLDNIDRLGEQCSCGNIKNASILDCFLNSPVFKYERTDLEKIIKILLEIITSSDELLQTNLNFIFDNIKKLMTKNDGIILDMSDKEIEEKIEQYLSVREEEKNKNGEVFTPTDLINEMLDPLPVSVWNNPDLKWLDPANGIGNFPMVVYQKLMNGLKKWEPSDAKRSKHIIENMLYMVEINPKNVKISKKIFGSNANICCANFLEEKDREKCLRQFGVDKFDIIIGNPPYNSGAIRAKTTDKIKHDKDSREEAETIWPDFVKESLSLLENKTGYLVFIHPASWIGFKSSIGNMFKNVQIKYLRYYNVVSAHKLFGRQSGEIPLTYYVLQNIDTKNDTFIYDNATNSNVEFNIYKHNFVPTESISLWKKILNFTHKYGNLTDNYSSVKNSKSLSDKFSSKQKYPIISIVMKNIVIQYSTTNNNKNNDKKLLLANSSMGYPIYDYLGIMYPKSSDQFLIYSNNNEKELRQLQNYFLTNLLFYLINITKTRQKFFDNKIFEVIPNITKITKYIDINDKFLIKTFKLNSTDLIGYNKYITSGEGRLDENIKNEIKRFKINISSEIVKEIKNENQIKLDEQNIKQMKNDVKKITKKNIKDANNITRKKGSKTDNDVKNHKRKNTRTQHSAKTGGSKNKTLKKSIFNLW
jgi:hypothetical protein